MKVKFGVEVGGISFTFIHKSNVCCFGEKLLFALFLLSSTEVKYDGLIANCYKLFTSGAHVLEYNLRKIYNKLIPSVGVTMDPKTIHLSLFLSIEHRKSFNV